MAWDESAVAGAEFASQVSEDSGAHMHTGDATSIALERALQKSKDAKEEARLQKRPKRTERKTTGAQELSPALSSHSQSRLRSGAASNSSSPPAAVTAKPEKKGVKRALETEVEPEEMMMCALCGLSGHEEGGCAFNPNTQFAATTKAANIRDRAKQASSAARAAFSKGGSCVPPSPFRPRPSVRGRGAGPFRGGRGSAASRGRGRAAPPGSQD